VSQEGRREQLARLDRWVEMQAAVLEAVRSALARKDEMDRLDLMIHARLVFQHIMRTVKAFDEWLQDPSIASVIPRDEMERVFAEAARAFEILAELDISHTSMVRGLLEEAAREGRLPVVTPRDKGEEGRRGLPATTLSNMPSTHPAGDSATT